MYLPKPRKIIIMKNLVVGHLTIVGYYKGYSKILQFFETWEETYIYIEKLGFNKDTVEVLE